jgi:prepilin-type N-terminal cleavage/methylation domain-containing protein
MKKNGITLMETMVVVAIFAVLFSATLTVLINQDATWRLGQDKLTVQQETRQAMNMMSVLLRQTNPDWVINSVHYPVTITGGNRIDFYKPGFDAEGNIATLRKVTFKLNPENTRQLLKKEGLSEAITIADNVESINIGGGCSGCAAFNCSTVSADCPVVSVTMQSRKNVDFTLTSKITLRNAAMAVGDETVVEEPEEGEF